MEAFTRALRRGIDRNGRHLDPAFPDRGLGLLHPPPEALPRPEVLPPPEGGGDRNGIPFYASARAKVAHDVVSAMPLRVSALRSLGSNVNVFAIESFVDANTGPVRVACAVAALAL